MDAQGSHLCIDSDILRIRDVGRTGTWITVIMNDFFLYFVVEGFFWVPKQWVYKAGFDSQSAQIVKK